MLIDGMYKIQEYLRKISMIKLYKRDTNKKRCCYLKLQ